MTNKTVHTLCQQQNRYGLKILRPDFGGLI